MVLYKMRHYKNNCEFHLQVAVQRSLWSEAGQFRISSLQVMLYLHVRHSETLRSIRNNFKGRRTNCESFKSILL